MYFRHGYAPDHYPTEKEWEAREMIERSLAIKCPSIDYQIVGMKKVQQVLTDDSELARFVPNEEDRSLMASFFAKIYGFDTELNPEILAQVRNNPDDFVLKPQREGGGNNFFGQDVINLLQGYEHDEEVQKRMKGFILMERIKPTPVKNLLARAGQVQEIDTISELGIFGVFLGTSSGVLLNEMGGHLLRTKQANANEGGVAAGYATVDTPYLV